MTIILALVTMAGAAAANSAVVPFLHTPAPQPIQKAAPIAAARPCADDDLHAEVGAAGAHKGFATQELRMTNRGAGACYLTGAPGAYLMKDGAAAEEVARRPQGPANLAARADLAPGDTAVMLIGAPGACDAAIGNERKVSTRLRVNLPGGGAKALEGAHVDTLCGPANILHLHVEQREEAHSSPVARLAGALRVEGRVMPGSELQYTVTLTNPTNAAIHLSPCPSFTQSLSAEGEQSWSTWRLNCAATGNEIAARSSVTYEMLLSVPAHFSADTAKLGWTLEDGPTAGVAVPLRERAR